MDAQTSSIKCICIFFIWKTIEWSGEMATCEIKETFSDATFTIQAHKYNWLQYFVYFTLLRNTICSFYPVSAAHNGSVYVRKHRHRHRYTNTDDSFTVKFNRQTCHMNMETRRYVYTYNSIWDTSEFIVPNNCQMCSSRLMFSVPICMGGVE